MNGIAVLISINHGHHGPRKFRSVESHEELCTHMDYIRESAKFGKFCLEFLDKLPCNSYKIYSDKNRNAYPVEIFKRILPKVKNESFETHFRHACQEKRSFYLAKLVSLGHLDN